MNPWKFLRVTLLLGVLIAVAANHFLGLARLADWDRTLWVTIYPIVADDGDATRQYVASLDTRQFSDIGAFLQREARRHGRVLNDPLRLQLAPADGRLPPPSPDGNGRLAIGLWSLQMRWWAWRRDAGDGLPEADIQLFLLYQQGRDGVALDRSLGVRKARLVVVNAFASEGMASRNRVVATHELLHVLGATDKYDPYTTQPLAPHGLAEPGRQPLYPQVQAEIMGGRIAESAVRSRMPAALEHCVVGELTAREIAWR